MVMENSGMTIHPVHGQRADAQGRATIMREGTDFIEVEADVASPLILLVTDAWARACRAPLEGSSQNRYELMPANYSPEHAPLAFHVAALLLWRRERRQARA
jgi:hypothetical protein